MLTGGSTGSVIPKINQSNTTFIGDQDKGLIAADMILDKAVRTYCCQHITENVKKDSGVGAKDLFWKLARSSHLPQFEEHMHTLATQKPKAAAYIEKIGLEPFSLAHFPSRGYTHNTSNIVEHMNSICLEEREQPGLIMLNGI